MAQHNTQTALFIFWQIQHGGKLTSDDSKVLVEIFADRDSDLHDKSEGDVLEYNGSSSSSVDDNESEEEVAEDIEGIEQHAGLSEELQVAKEIVIA